MLKSKSEKTAAILSILSLILFFIPEVIHTLVAPPFKIATVLCLACILILVLIAANKRQKLIFGGVFLFFVVLFASFVIFGGGFG